MRKFNGLLTSIARSAWCLCPVLYTPRRRNSTIYVSGKQQTRKQTLQELRSEQLHISYSAAKNLQNKLFINNNDFDSCVGKELQ